MPARKPIILGAAVALMLVNLGVVAVAATAFDSRSGTPVSAVGEIQQGIGQVGLGQAPAPATQDQRGVNGSSAVLGPAPPGTGIAYPGQPGVFQPEYPPFASTGVAGDGVTAWGVAFQEVPNATTEPGSALVKSAFEDAHKRAQALASAVGIKLGDLAGISDQAANQAFFGDCVKPLPAQPGPGGSAPGSGTSDGPKPQLTANPEPPVTTVAPAPPCTEKHYAVAWVLVRYHID